jgi:hypothetical protein
LISEWEFLSSLPIASERVFDLTFARLGSLFFFFLAFVFMFECIVEDCESRTKRLSDFLRPIAFAAVLFLYFVFPRLEIANKIEEYVVFEQDHESKGWVLKCAFRGATFSNFSCWPPQRFSSPSCGMLRK